MDGNFCSSVGVYHGFNWILPEPLQMILSVIQQKEFAESQFKEFRPPAPITRDSASIFAESIWPNQPIKNIQQEKYHGWPSFFVEKDGGRIILSIPTGHYYIKTRYTRRTFSPKRELVHTKIYWGKIFKTIHATGWLDRRLGTWLADIFSLTLITFGLTGSMMWTIPRVQRLIRSRFSKNA